MAAAIQQARAVKSQALMKRAIKAADPLCDGNEAPVDDMVLPKGSLKSLHDQIDKVIEVEVADVDETMHTVVVQSAPHSRAALKIELNDANMELLTRTPMEPSVTAAFTPTVHQPHVAFKVSTNSCVVKYYDDSKHQ
eukprot:8187576-Pyramimonas_sp.AAC.1